MMSYFFLIVMVNGYQNSYLNNLTICSNKHLRIMNLGDIRATEGVAAVLQNEEDDAVDPHLERIRNEAGGDDSEEVQIPTLMLICFH